MLSYDAMIRLEVDTTRLAPETTLSLIDLSTGNIIAQQTFAWPPKEADAKAMLALCRDGAEEDARKPAAGKLRVRTLWAEDAIDNERIRPLGKRLIEVFDEALRRSERVALVHHLEAATQQGGIAAAADGAEPAARRAAIHAAGRRHDRAARRRGRRPRQDASPRRRWRSACGSARGPATRATG